MNGHCHLLVNPAARYGGDFVLARNAGLFTPGLVAVCIRPISRINWFMVAVRLLLGQQCPSGCSLVTGDSFHVSGTKPVQVDGDLCGFSPVQVSTETGYVRIVF